MSSEHTAHHTFEAHPHTHLFLASDSVGAVVYRTDTMQQAVCSAELGRQTRAVLSGEASPDTLRDDLRHFLFDPHRDRCSLRHSGPPPPPPTSTPSM